MTGARRRTFPLIPRRPLAGTAFGTQPSLRRGSGSDVAGSRPYRPGDRLSSVDWFASARLSAVTGRDEFVVRQTYADDAPRVLVVCDRRPSMGLYGPEWPFLSKPDAIRETVAAIAASARAARAEIGWLDVSAGGTTWLPPRNALATPVVDRRLSPPWDAPPDALARSLDHVARRVTEVPQGAFVFVVSDFLSPPPLTAWRPALVRGLDVVPVLVQDPTWEASFPDVGGVLVPLADPVSGEVFGVRFTAGEVAERRAANERRTATLRDELRLLGIDFVAVEAADPVAVDAAFALWAARRRLVRRAQVHA